MLWSQALNRKKLKLRSCCLSPKHTVNEMSLHNRACPSLDVNISFTRSNKSNLSFVIGERLCLMVHATLGNRKQPVAKQYSALEVWCANELAHSYSNRINSNRVSADITATISCFCQGSESPLLWISGFIGFFGFLLLEWANGKLVGSFSSSQAFI